MFLLLFVTTRAVCYSRVSRVPKFNPEFYRLADLSINEGDYLMLKDKSTWIAGSDNVLFSVQVCRKVFFGISLELDRMEEPETSRAAKLPHPTTRGWSSEKALELVKVLQTKALPYGPWYCNAGHYMRYIMYAQTYKSIWKPSCPLQRDLTTVSIDEINSGTFYLEYGWRNLKKLYVHGLDYCDPFPLITPPEWHPYSEILPLWREQQNGRFIPIRSPSPTHP